jgi:hypothetical protein
MIEKIRMWKEYNNKEEKQIIEQIKIEEPEMKKEEKEVKVEILEEEKEVEINRDIKVIEELELLEKVTGDKYRIALVYNHDVHYFYLKELPTQKDIPEEIIEFALSHKLYTYERVKEGEA